MLKKRRFERSGRQSRSSSETSKFKNKNCTDEVDKEDIAGEGRARENRLKLGAKNALFKKEQAEGTGIEIEHNFSVDAGQSDKMCDSGKWRNTSSTWENEGKRSEAQEAKRTMKIECVRNENTKRTRNEIACPKVNRKMKNRNE